MKEIKKKMKPSKQRKTYDRCPNCNNILFYGATNSTKGPMCPHCLQLLNEKK